MRHARTDEKRGRGIHVSKYIRSPESRGAISSASAQAAVRLVLENNNNKNSRLVKTSPGRNIRWEIAPLLYHRPLNMVLCSDRKMEMPWVCVCVCEGRGESNKHAMYILGISNASQS